MSPHTICLVGSKARTDVGNKLLCRTDVTNIRSAAVVRACAIGSVACQYLITRSRTSVPTGGHCRVTALLLMDIDLIIWAVVLDSKWAVSIPARTRHETRVDHNDRTVFCLLKFLARNTTNDMASCSSGWKGSRCWLHAKPVYKRTAYPCCLLVAGRYACWNHALAVAI